MSKKSDLSLADVQQAFAHWRRERPTYSVPPALRAQAVGLLAQHRVSDVMKALRLDHRRLSRWRRELAATNAAIAVSDFVELPAAALKAPAVVLPALALTLTRQAVDGSTVTIAGTLNAVQWRWALEMLQGSTS
jgi:primosomal replication protein N